MPRSLSELDREVARLAQEQVAHDTRDQGQFGLLRTDIVNMGKQLEAKIDTAVNGIQMQINPLIKARVEDDSYARGMQAQRAIEEKRKAPNPWMLAAWPAVVALLLGFMISWATRDHIQGGIGSAQSTVTTTSSVVSPGAPKSATAAPIAVSPPTPALPAPPALDPE